MDYAGQKLAEQLNLYILVIFAVVAFIAGYVTGSFGLLMKIYAVGLVLDAALIVPDWPWLNKQPLQWLPALKEDQPIENEIQTLRQSHGKKRS